MSTDELTPDPAKANAEYVRRLNQQLIQKESIIKILQGKLRNLESGLARQGRAGDGKPPRQGPEAGSADEPPPGRARSDNGQDPEVARLRERARDLEREVQRAHEESASLRGELSAVRETAAVPARDGDVVAELRLELDTARSEITRLREEAARLCDERERSVRELEAQRGMRPAVADPLLATELARREEEISQAHALIERLQAEAARTREAGTRAPDVACGSPSSPVALEAVSVQALIGMLERMEGLEAMKPADVAVALRGFAGHTRQLAQAAGVERIPTVGATFEPALHHAVEMVYSSEHPHNMVIREASPGFRAQGTIVRPADVVVSLNPFYCPTCQKVTIDGGRFCHICGARVLGREREGIRILDDRANCQGHLNLAQGQEEAGDLAGARAHYQRVLAIDAKNPQALEGLARLSERQGLYQESLEHIETLLREGGQPAPLVKQRERIEAKVRILEQLRSLV